MWGLSIPIAQMVIGEEFAGVVFAAFVAAIAFLVMALRTESSIITSLTKDLKESMAREDTLQSVKENLLLEIKRLQVEISDLRITIRKGEDR